MEKILKELRSIVLSRPLECLNWREGHLELKKLEDIPARAKAGIARIERNTTGIKVVFHDKLRAAELLLRYDPGKPKGEETNLLEAILEATAGEIDTDDLEEVCADDNGVFIAEGS